MTYGKGSLRDQPYQERHSSPHRKGTRDLRCIAQPDAGRTGSLLRVLVEWEGVAESEYLPSWLESQCATGPRPNGKLELATSKIKESRYWTESDTDGDNNAAHKKKQVYKDGVEVDPTRCFRDVLRQILVKVVRVGVLLCAVCRMQDAQLR